MVWIGCTSPPTGERLSEGLEGARAYGTVGGFSARGTRSVAFDFSQMTILLKRLHVHCDLHDLCASRSPWNPRPTPDLPSSQDVVGFQKLNVGGELLDVLAVWRQLASTWGGRGDEPSRSPCLGGTRGERTH